MFRSRIIERGLLPLRESESKVLLALLRGGATPIMDIPDLADLGGNAVYNAVRWLLERGLVTEQREKTPPRRRVIRLNDEGRKVAELLQKVEQELKS